MTFHCKEKSTQQKGIAACSELLPHVECGVVRVEGTGAWGVVGVGSSRGSTNVVDTAAQAASLKLISATWLRGQH